MADDNGTFSEWRRLILHQLEQLETGQKELEKFMHKLDVRMEKLVTEVNIRAAIVGGAASLVLTVIGGVIIALIV